jgi:ATP-dependent Clp protease ATP-binding subunit ClpX
MPGESAIPVDTSNILFICGGAFVGLEEIVARRLGRGGFGFDRTGRGEAEKALHHVLPCDLEGFGLIPELLGRLPVIATLDNLGVNDLVRILQEPKNSLLSQYRKLLAYHGADLEFTPGAIQEVARIAHVRNTGARGLRAVVEQVVEGVLFEAPEAGRGQVFVIDERAVRGEAPAQRKPIKAVPPLRALIRRRATG